jgi:hypothetical protein
MRRRRSTLARAGASATLSTTTPGQNISFGFSGAAGQRVFVSVTSSCCSAYAYIVRTTTGAAVTDNFNTVSTGGGSIDTATLPASDSYQIVLDPLGSATGSVSVTAYDVPGDDATPIAIGGPAVTTSLVVGQNGALPFDAAQGQTVKLSWSGQTIPLSDYKILRPNGSTLTSYGYTASSSGSLTFQPSTSGTHTLVVDPVGARTGASTVALTIVGDAPADGAEFAACGTTAVFRAEPVSGSNPQYQFQTATDSGFSALVDDSGSRPSTNT